MEAITFKSRNKTKKKTNKRSKLLQIHMSGKKRVLPWLWASGMFGWSEAKTGKQFDKLFVKSHRSSYSHLPPRLQRWEPVPN